MKLKKLFLLGIASTVGIKPLTNNFIMAAIPSGKKATVQDYYDNLMLKIIVDSLKLIDPRNSITPELGVYVPGKVFFGVEIYSNIKKGDLENVTIGEAGKKNRCIVGTYNMAKVLTPCAYDQGDVFIGVRYLEDNAVRPYLGTILNITRPGRPYTAAFSMTPR